MESVLASFRKGINSTLHLIFISAFSLLMHHLLPFDTYWEKKCYKTTISFFLRYNWQETFSLALWKEKNLRIRVTESIYFVFQKTGQRKWLFNQYKASQSERKTKKKKKKTTKKQCRGNWRAFCTLCTRVKKALSLDYAWATALLAGVPHLNQQEPTWGERETKDAVDHWVNQACHH